MANVYGLVIDDDDDDDGDGDVNESYHQAMMMLWVSGVKWVRESVVMCDDVKVLVNVNDECDEYDFYA